MKSKLRIVTLGDSYTFGQCVGDREIYSSYLEKILPYTEVLNFGVKAYGFDQMLLRLPSALTFQPDIVIVGFYNDDVERVKYNFIDYQKPKFILVDGQLELINASLTHPEKYAKQFHFLTADVFSIFWDKYFKNRIKEAEMTTNVTISILSAMKKAVNQAGASLFLLYLPTYGEVSSNIPSSHRAYNKFCLNNEEFCLDPTEAMFKYIQARSDPESYFSCHYAKEIHEVIANYVKDNMILEKY